jgi:hypothetical protein
MSGVVPVALFAFRRADLLERTLAALRANGVTRIHAFSDGARNEGDDAGVAGVRRVLHSVDWAEMHLVQRPENVGLNASIVSGISQVLSTHDRLVVCEEDIEFAPGAYAYMCGALERYHAEPRVMCVCGWTHPEMTPPDAQDAPHFTGRFAEWGWATWRRAWAGFPEMSRDRLLALCTSRGVDLGKYGWDIADWYRPDQPKDSWDYNFNLHILLNDGLALLPPRAMTLHIGYDARSSHIQDRTAWKDRAESPPPPGEVRWPDVRENPASAALWQRATTPPPRPSLGRRVRRRLARMFGELVRRGPRA